jgi:D-alanine transaminase/branched-chain amino acid aminotransferase|tara:strand:- start:591 stop:1478 length:888 start_codon:yes stop_codon:yes gene_type:complete
MSYVSFFKNQFIPTDEISLNFSDNFLTIVRGYQVFTFFKTAYGGKPLFLDHHIDRLLSNAESMQMIVEQSHEDIKQLVMETLDKNDCTNKEFNVMVILSGGKPDDSSALSSKNAVNISVIVTLIKVFPPESYTKGIALGLFEYQRAHGELKGSFSYVGATLAQNIVVRDSDYDEALYTSNNMVLEGTTFSFFAINHDGTVLTSNADGRILRSVTRLVLLDIMQRESISFEEKNLSLDEVYQCKEAFIVSSHRDIIPVISVDNHTIGDGLVGESTKKLMELYQKEVLELVSNRNNV